MPYLLYRRKTAPTGRKLAQALGIPHGKNLTQDTDLLIRWGCTKSVSGMVNAVLNSAAAIHRAYDKALARQMMAWAGLPAPEVFRPGEAWQWLHDNPGRALVGRPAHHTSGSGFWVCRAPEEVQAAHQQGADYFSPLLELDREYRVHVFKSRVLFVQRKKPRDGVEADPIRRNHAHGWYFYRVRIYPEEIEDLAVEAVKALGLDFGAVDIARLMDMSFTIFEVNTAPGLTVERNLEAWVAAFQEYITQLREE